MFRKLALLFSFCLLCLSQAQAHEFILKPAIPAAVKAGQAIPVSIVSAHVFMQSVELEGEGDANNLSVALYDNGSTSTAVPLRKNEKALTWDAVVHPAHPGTAIVAAHRKPMFWTQTTKGWKQASKKGLSGVIKSGKYEKFAKALIPVSGKTKGFDKAIGQRLEIIPAQDPATVRPGEELALRVLLDGQPLATPIYATYDGFSSRKNTYAFFSEDMDEQGLSRVSITAPGLWMVRVEHKIHEPNEEYDDHVMRSVLLFEIL